MVSHGSSADLVVARDDQSKGDLSRTVAIQLITQDRVALSCDNLFCRDGRKVAVNLAAMNGVQVVEDITTKIGVASLTSEVQRLQGSNPDNLFLIAGDARVHGLHVDRRYDEPGRLARTREAARGAGENVHPAA